MNLNLTKLKGLATKYDYALVFIVLFLSLVFIKPFQIAFFVAQVVSSFTYLLKRVIKGQPVTLVKVALIFIVFVVLTQGLFYLLTNLIGAQ